MPATLAAEHLEELGHLTDTAGAEVVGTIGQRLDAPTPRLYIGEGKAKELKDLIEELGATLVIFDEELSPAQGKNLEETLKTRVMDRAELILDIFATRARTSEAQMQVELAQLQYMRSRLKRMWTHLSRIRGGIGARGPGETQLETDRRLINTRIRDLRDKLEVVAQRRATQRKGRTEMFRAALVGYTNAGKSSILRALSGADTFVEDRLFATLDAATRQIELEGQEILLTDTVGFIRKLPHHLVASFRATLEETADADLLLHVIDASHPQWTEQKEVVEGVLEELGMREHATLLVFNKTDRMTHMEEELLRERTRGAYAHPVVYVSALAEGGLAPLEEALLNAQRARRTRVRVRIPARDGEALASVYREGEVLEQGQDGTEISLLARVPAATLGRLQQRDGVVVETG